MQSKSFTDLIVWQKAHEFVLNVYELTKNYPKSELYGLTAQFRRAAVSIPANIAEGFVKNGVADKLRYYNIAEGSIHECKYYLILSKDLGYIDNLKFLDLLEEISKLLGSYMKTINQSRNSL
ncbi:four helix bundle protein [Ignavibacteria bacterium 4148-Me]|uniref:four helix bundle protein n=1 Tax=Rosettibacter primus TaxID=3111523 RepID=UPI00336C08C4